jgi:hypothetical protein
LILEDSHRSALVAHRHPETPLGRCCHTGPANQHPLAERSRRARYVFHSSNLLRNDNPGWPISNATETAKVPDGALPMRLAPEAGGWARPHRSARGAAEAVCNACAVATAWLIGLPRRAGRRLYALNDAEAGWHNWQVIEMFGGLGRQYRDLRWDVLRYDPAIRRDEIHDDTPRPDDTGCPLG